MNILYLGAESANWIINLCNKICEQGHKVTCVVQQLDEYDKDNPMESHKNLSRINIDYNTMFNPEKIIKTLKDKNKLDDKYDVIFGSHAPVSPITRHLSEKLNNIPWGVMLLDIPTDLIRTQKARGELWNIWFSVMFTADTIVFNTFVARDEYEKYTGVRYGNENVVTYATHIPDEYKLSGSGIKGDYVVSACRLTPIKNISMITRALAMTDRPIKQVVIGRDKGDLMVINKIAKEHKVEVIYKGMVSEKEKYELIRDSLCLIYPQTTKYIGGLSPWEGMMIGKPTIVTECRVLRELFGDDIEYVDTTIPAPLYRAINKIYDNKYNEDKINKASEYANKEASFKTMATKLLSAFERMKK